MARSRKHPTELVPSTEGPPDALTREQQVAYIANALIEGQWPPSPVERLQLALQWGCGPSGLEQREEAARSLLALLEHRDIRKVRLRAMLALDTIMRQGGPGAVPAIKLLLEELRRAPEPTEPEGAHDREGFVKLLQTPPPELSEVLKEAGWKKE